MIDNNGTIDGLKDVSHSRVGSKFCFACLFLDFDLPKLNVNLFLLRCLLLESIHTHSDLRSQEIDNIVYIGRDENSNCRKRLDSVKYWFKRAHGFEIFTQYKLGY